MIFDSWESLTPEAQAVIHDFSCVFKEYVATRLDFTVRELEYLAGLAVHEASDEVRVTSSVVKTRCVCSSE